MERQLDVVSADFSANSDLQGCNKIPVIDLECLSRNFKLDTIQKVQGTNNYFYTPPNNTLNFTKLKYNKSIKGEGTEAYNRPPIGPIEPGFYCIACGKYAPEHHEPDCLMPDKISLRLTLSGLTDIINNPDANTKIPDINELRRDKTKLESFITEHFRGTTGDTYSNLSYIDVVPLRGNEKTPFKTSKTSFNNALFITFTPEPNTEINSTTRNTNIRVYAHGLIDIKGAPLDEAEFTNMMTILLERINSTNCVNINNFNRVLQINQIQPRNKFEAIKELSYFKIIKAQFYYFGEEHKEKILDLEKLNTAFISKHRDTPDLVYKSVDMNIDTISKVGKKIKDSLIYKFTIPNRGTLTLMISRFGTFQFTLSNHIPTSLSENIRIMKSLRDKFTNIDNKHEFSNENLETKVMIYDKGFQTVSGLVPPKTISQHQGTEVCAKNQAGKPIRPNPYDWGGICPVDGHFIPPVGKQGGDITTNINGVDQQLYFPCCKKMSLADQKTYKTYLLNGFPPSDAFGNNYGIYKNHDALSGLVNKEPSPGDIVMTKTPDSTWEAPQWTPVKIMGVHSKNPYSYKASVLGTNRPVIVPRTDIERQSRKFRGLRELSKTDLVKILSMNNLIA
jgi:hypothetical protein